VKSLTNCLWIGSSRHNPCPVVRCVFVKILHIFLTVCPDTDVALISQTDTLSLAQSDRFVELHSGKLNTSECPANTLSDIMTSGDQLATHCSAQKGDDDLVYMVCSADLILSDTVTNSDQMNLVASVITQQIEHAVVNEVKRLMEGNAGDRSTFVSKRTICIGCRSAV